MSVYNSSKAYCYTNSDQSSYIPYVYTRTPFVPPSGSVFTANTHYTSKAACQADDATAAGKVSYYLQNNCNAITPPGQTGLLRYPVTNSVNMVCGSAPTVTTSAGFMRYQNFATNDCTGIPDVYYDQQLDVCKLQSDQTNTNPTTYYNTDSYMFTSTTEGGVTTLTKNAYSGSTTCSGTPTTQVMSSSTDGCVLAQSGHGSSLITVVSSTQPQSGFSSSVYYAGYNSQAGCLSSTASNLEFLYPVNAQACDYDETSSPTGAPVVSTFFYKQTLVGCNTASVSSAPSKSPTYAPTTRTPTRAPSTTPSAAPSTAPIRPPSVPVVPTTAPTTSGGGLSSRPPVHATKSVHSSHAKTGVSGASKHSNHAHLRRWSSTGSGSGKVDVEVDVGVKVDVK